jgi:hypothetical protein
VKWQPPAGQLHSCPAVSIQVETPTGRLCVIRTLTRPKTSQHINQYKQLKMKKITVEYGVDSVTKQVETGFTFGDLQECDSFKAALGFGDNTKALVNGIEQGRTTVIPDGATVRLETAANTKAL